MQSADFANSSYDKVFGSKMGYEYLLRADSRCALSEGSLFFEGKSAVQQAPHKVTRRLAELEIPYAVVGGMALSHHGFPRFTDDVNLLVSQEGLREIHANLDGLGYLPPLSGSKHLRDTEVGVKIEFLITGQFPGDGKPKPVAFPDPQKPYVADSDGIRYLKLPLLVELKLASGMTNPGRIKDLGDVQELIKVLGLAEDFAERLNPYVRPKYRELWQGSQNAEEPGEPSAGDRSG
ncbi:MAG TPA: hypothetical protein VG326_12860 [Tepidisphaeraceae bacterium]|jgi:hypothetical protein|nr:hypothetical protein [Tepidisphaeraceae bacterium]